MKETKMEKGSLISLLFCCAMFYSCANNNVKSDAYGNFEAEETIISAETSGKVLDIKALEGDKISVNQLICVIDTIQLALKVDQLKSSIGAVASKTQDVASQIDALNEKKRNIIREKNRIERLYKDSAATAKQLDDINGELEYMNKQIKATEIQLNTGNRGLLSEKNPLMDQIKQLYDQIEKSKIKSPLSGEVVNKYIQLGEFVVPGKALFKIADMNNMIFRAYISGDMLSSVKIGQIVKVKIDSQNGAMKEYKGEIYWISPKAEFTPKIIQTKNERVNLSYAIKIRVKNDGLLKIGMPAEMQLN
jgi:HlyD family secretion protein